MRDLNIKIVTASLLLMLGCDAIEPMKVTHRSDPLINSDNLTVDDSQWQSLEVNSGDDDPYKGVTIPEGCAIPENLSFESHIEPFIQSSCVSCHGNGSALGDFSKLSTDTMASDLNIWEKIIARMDTSADYKRMPPASTKEQYACETAKIKIFQIQKNGFIPGEQLNSTKEQPLVCKDKSERQLSTTGLRRLSLFEISNSVQQNIGISRNYKEMGDDPLSSHNLDNEASSLASLSTYQFERIYSYVVAAVDQAFTQDAANWNQCQDKPVDCTYEMIKDHSAKAFKGYATNADITYLTSLYDDILNKTSDRTLALKSAVIASFVSPLSLYRNMPASVATNANHLINRLSFLLTAGPPDYAMLIEAAKPMVSNEALESLVDQLFADSRLDRSSRHFASTWLKTKYIESPTLLVKDMTVYPQFNANLRSSFREETELFMVDFFRENRSLGSIVTSDYSYLNQELAEFYGVRYSSPMINSPEFNGFKRFDMRSTTRRGILGQGSVLSQLAKANESSVVSRGHWVLEALLCEAPPPIPDNLEINDLAELTAGTTPKEILADHRDKPQCKGCHAVMDEVGFSLEGFDGIGAMREIYRNGEKVDTTADIPGVGAFQNHVDFMTAIAARDSYKRCVTATFAAAALGRSLNSDEICEVEDMVQKQGASDPSIKDIVKSIATSDLFKSR